MLRLDPLLTGCLLLLSMNIMAADSRHAMYLDGPFATGPDVTRACLECHEDEARDFMQHEHWTWSLTQAVPGSNKTVELGKREGINNFCIAVPSNWPRCTSCHAGYGWRDASFDFSDPTNIDCLVCHDTTGSYRKVPTGAGMPAEDVDLLRVAQNVGRTSRQTCGSCHFYGGGGDHVKHGDLDSSLIEADRTYDVHMGIDGPDMACQFCHQTMNHRIPGQAMSVSLGSGKRVECGGCHRERPHQKDILNRHSASVACQTCHIPTFAKSKPTKVWWDWSKAGENREPENDRYGMQTYSKKKGEFRWAKDVAPEYAWYNGQSLRYLLGDKLDPTEPLYLSSPLGSIKDENARIYPFKLMKGRQPYDTANNYLVVPKLFGGYWQHYDWNQAITNGMAVIDLPYSGKFSFIETRMYWQITHMVVPKEQALKCDDCHGEKGRLDWSALGYKDDPQKIGGRTTKKY